MLGRFVQINPGNDRLFHKVPLAVPWALEGLTTVFGMGTGVSPPVWSPENLQEQSTVDSPQLTVKSVQTPDCELLTADCSLNSVASFLMFGGHQPPLVKANCELSTVDCRLFLMCSAEIMVKPNGRLGPVS